MNIKQFNSFLKKNNPKLQKKLRLYRTISVAASIGLGISSFYASLNFTIAYFYNTPVDKNTLLNTGIGLGASTGLYYANRKLLLTKIIREYNETIATKE